ncbi:MAG: hypothetical protein RR048_00310 [Oscillospiraceae bacterium]
MSKEIFCNFETIAQADMAISAVKKEYPQKLKAFFVDNTYKLPFNNPEEHIPHGIPSAVLSQLAVEDVPSEFSNVAQAPASIGGEHNSNVTIVKFIFSDDVSKSVANKIAQLGGTNINTFF